MKKPIALFCVAALGAACFAFSGARFAQSQGEDAPAPAASSDADSSNADAQNADAKPEAAAGAPAGPAPRVPVYPAVGVDQPEPRRYAGQIVSIEEVEIVPRVTGWIEKINFKEGDFVNEGDVLYEIENTTYVVAVKAAKSSLAQAQAALKNAETNYKRAKDLYEKQAGSEADFDDAEQRLDQAKASVMGAEAALEDAENTLTYTTIKTPISGRVGKTKITRGNLVTPQTGAIVDVKSFSPIYVRFAIGESVFNKTFGGDAKIRDLADIRLCPVGENPADEKALATFPQAKIELIDNKVDAGTNTVVIWATFENADNRFFPGSYATVLLAKKFDKPVVGVILSALQTDGDKNFVYVVDKNGLAQRRDLKLGAISGRYQLVESGIEIGESVVVDGMNKLQPGVKVETIDWNPEGMFGAPEQNADAQNAEQGAADQEKR